LLKKRSEKIVHLRHGRDEGDAERQLGKLWPVDANVLSRLV